MITLIGYTFKIPDSVMGLTFLAIGTSVPEVFSSLIVSRQGKGSMAVSNSIGSNTFDILVSILYSFYGRNLQYFVKLERLSQADLPAYSNVCW
jgi:Ca2+/Na+ antiporter